MVLDAATDNCRTDGDGRRRGQRAHGQWQCGCLRSGIQPDCVTRRSVDHYDRREQRDCQSYNHDCCNPAGRHPGNGKHHVSASRSDRCPPPLPVHGRAVDPDTDIVAVSVNGVAATTTDGFATWSAAAVPLAAGDNALNVAVEKRRSGRGRRSGDGVSHAGAAAARSARHHALMQATIVYSFRTASAKPSLRSIFPAGP